MRLNLWFCIENLINKIRNAMMINSINNLFDLEFRHFSRTNKS